MPMGIVSDSDFDSEISRVSVPPPATKTPVKVPEVVERGPNVPDSLRRIIGDEAASNGREAAVELARQFGISPSSASAYAVGATSTATYDERPNQDVIKSARGRIIKKAGAKMRMALNAITADKLEGTKARDLAGIAKDMSAIVRNMEDSDPNKNRTDPNAPKATFLVYAPTVREENHYQTVIAKD